MVLITRATFSLATVGKRDKTSIHLFNLDQCLYASVWIRSPLSNFNSWMPLLFTPRENGGISRVTWG